MGYPGQGETIFVINAIKKIVQKQANKESNFALILKLTGSIEKYLKILLIFIRKRGINY
jgi:hypothetical protein